MVKINTEEADWKKISETVKSHNFKHLDIKNERFNNLSVSIDYDVDPAIDRFVCILHTPDTEKMIAPDFVEHYHIHLKDENAVKLFNYLKEYLLEKELI